MPVVSHAMSSSDAQTMQALREALSKAPKLEFEPANRPAYDQIFAQVPMPETVRFEQEEVGGVPAGGVVRAQADSRAVLLYLHGGGYVMGSASAYRNFVGHIAKAARAAVFIADYALAPERPFPAAMNDVRDIHEGLLGRDYARIALGGDSCGAGLALSFLTDRTVRPDRVVGVAAMSPWIDLSLSGASMVSRDADDPLLSKATLAEAAALYLGKHRPEDAQPTPLQGDISAMPPVRIDVGTAEVLLDDALRFAMKAEQAGLNCEVHVWDGMIHVFPSSFAMLQAAAQAVEAIGSFLAGALGTERPPAP